MGEYQHSITNFDVERHPLDFALCNFCARVRLFTLFSFTSLWTCSRASWSALMSMISSMRAWSRAVKSLYCFNRVGRMSNADAFNHVNISSGHLNLPWLSLPNLFKEDWLINFWMVSPKTGQYTAGNYNRKVAHLLSLIRSCIGVPPWHWTMGSMES